MPLRARHCRGLGVVAQGNGAERRTEIRQDLYEAPTAYPMFAEDKEELIYKKTEVYQPRQAMVLSSSGCG